MVSFTLNGLNNTVTNVTGFVATTAATENTVDAPELDLQMTASAWNTVFSFGEKIFHTYSAELPDLVHNVDSSTLGTKNLTAGTGNKILQEPEETEQTIADDVIRWWIYKITGVRNQDILYSNIGTINGAIDALLVGTTSTDLVYKLKASLDNADNLTETNTTTANLSRQLQLLTLSGAPDRLGNESGEMYNSANLLSNLVGDLTSVTSGDPDAVLTSGFTLSDNGSSVTEDAVIGSVTIRGGKIVGVVFSTAGAGYAVGDVITITHASINSGTGVTYTLVAGDLDNNGGFTNGLYNFLFSAGDTLTFQVSIGPNTTNAISGPTSKNYAIKITMA